MTDRLDPFEELDQLFDEFLQVESPLTEEPPVDVVDADGEILVVVDLPGHDAETVEVTLEENRHLTVTAEERDADRGGEYVTRERPTGGVSRTVRLPGPVDSEATEASYDQGVLTVTLPKLHGADDGTDIPVN